MTLPWMSSRLIAATPARQAAAGRGAPSRFGLSAHRESPQGSLATRSASRTSVHASRRRCPATVKPAGDVVRARSRSVTAAGSCCPGNPWQWLITASSWLPASSAQRRRPFAWLGSKSGAHWNRYERRGRDRLAAAPGQSRDEHEAAEMGARRPGEQALLAFSSAVNVATSASRPRAGPAQHRSASWARSRS